MRGKRRETCHRLHVLGITPADAGKTEMDDYTLARKTDHPRGCGENDPAVPGENAAAGSPPRMRGKPDGSAAAMYLIGITPADAGKTAFMRGVWGCYWDHPRGCGENSYHSCFKRNLVGSPPRMRGKLLLAECRGKKIRITPADAGKTR